MKAYSTDLRKKILQRYDEGHGTQREIAALFGVSRSFLQSILRLRRKSGDIKPKGHGGGNPGTFNCEKAQKALRKLLEADKEATLQQLCDLLKKEYEIPSSPASVCRALKKMGLTRKKNSSLQANVIRNASRPNGKHSSRKSNSTTPIVSSS